jgi:hypothetical protein
MTMCLTTLAHKYPKVRKRMAEQLYIVLMSHSNLMPDDEEVQDKILGAIADSNWLGDTPLVQELRLPLYAMLGCEAPAAAPKAAAAAPKTAKPEEETYAGS